jgi:hypothetical protein
LLERRTTFPAVEEISEPILGANACGVNEVRGQQRTDVGGAEDACPRDMAFERSARPQKEISFAAVSESRTHR